VDIAYWGKSVGPTQFPRTHQRNSLAPSSFRRPCPPQDPWAGPAIISSNIAELQHNEVPVLYCEVPMEALAIFSMDITSSCSVVGKSSGP
jgi:hypothetical protein